MAKIFFAIFFETMLYLGEEGIIPFHLPSPILDWGHTPGIVVMIVDSKVIEGISYKICYPYTSTVTINHIPDVPLTDIGLQDMVDEIDFLLTGYRLVASF